MPTGDFYPETYPLITNLQLKVVEVEANVKNHEKLMDKLADSIKSIEAMNNSIVKMLYAHEEKHDGHDTAEDKLENEIDKIDHEIEDDIKELHNKISEANKETQAKIDSLKKEVNERLDLLYARISGSDSTQADVKTTLEELKKWKFTILVIASILVFLFDHINWKFLSTLFGG